MAETKIEYVAIRDLKPWTNNARTHSKKQVRQIADSIAQFGFTNPVLIDESGTIIAGHGRVAAAKQLGMDDVPCLRFDHMTEAEKRAYVFADNKLALNAGWDEDLLAAELGALMSDDLEFDIGLTGFSIAEIDTLMEAVIPEEEGDPADEAVPDEAPARVSPGEIWQLGQHRLICGDALDAGTITSLMGGELATMVFTDPP
ncbi:MAG: ParB/Srx family N-terminal domain-containing protein [Pseudomonadota bacterium]